MASNDPSDRLVDDLTAALQGAPEVKAAYLFGSRSRAEERPDSDADVGVLFDRKVDLSTVVRLQQQLEDATGMRVDVVNVGTASPFLALDVIRGRRILCRDDLACDEFELYVLRRAGDLAPFERERRRMILEVSP